MPRNDSVYRTTVGGNVSRGEVFAKLLDHLREAQDCAALMSHLHNTEGNDMDKVLAKGWLGVQELLSRQCIQITKLAMNKLQ